MSLHTKSASVHQRPGQPLLVLLAVLLGWAGMRAAVWQDPFPDMLAVQGPAKSQSASLLVHQSALEKRAAPSIAIPPQWAFEDNGLIAPPRQVTIDAPVIAFDPAGTLASQQVLWLAAMAQIPVPHDVAIMLHEQATPAAQSESGANFSPQGTGLKRWSMDGWLFLRPGSVTGTAAGPSLATYGASQAGGVFRYQLDPSSRYRPSAYVRATKALAGQREAEVAAGLSVRPFARVPLAAYAELRATDGAASRELRPAALVVSELPSARLPMGFRAEAYGAAGYVGGAFSTAFVDGQARVDRKIASFDLGALSAGAGAWGGAQKGAARLDVGPTVSVNIMLGQTPARVAMDYRLRVAGDSQPNSGVAVTLSTGF